VLLPDGKFLIVAGHNAGRDMRIPQTYNPATGTFVSGTAWTEAYPEEKQRGYHNCALLLQDGRVLLASGRTHTTEPDQDYNSDEQATCRYYSPRYLDAQFEPRPSIADIRDGGESTGWLAYDQPRSIHFENGPIHRVVLMAPGANTHSFDQNQRCIILKDIPGGASTPVDVIGPQDAQVAPPGYYLLFILRQQGGELVPCVAWWVWVG
jgi:hypothetical protein